MLGQLPVDLRCPSCRRRQVHLWTSTGMDLHLPAPLQKRGLHADVALHDRHDHLQIRLHLQAEESGGFPG